MVWLAVVFSCAACSSTCSDIVFTLGLAQTGQVKRQLVEQLTEMLSSLLTILSCILVDVLKHVHAPTFRCVLHVSDAASCLHILAQQRHGLGISPLMIDSVPTVAQVDHHYR